MSTSVKILIFAAFFISGAFAGPKENKRDLIAVEKAQLAKLATRTELTVKEFLQFVSEIDAKCTNETATETVSGKAEAICSLYYKMYKIEELFVDNPNGPSWSQCQSYGVTSDGLSVDDNVKLNVNKIASNLCPRN